MNKYENPFQITTPEDLSAEEMAVLFVDVFNDFKKVLDPGHTFLIGPRGTGKSMMLRYMQPDCQCLSRNCGIKDLPFLAFYIPLKNTSFKMPELLRLKNKYANDLLNENLLVLHCAITVFETISTEPFIGQINCEELNQYYKSVFCELFNNIDDAEGLNCTADIINHIIHCLKQEYKYAIKYAKELGFINDIAPYKGQLFDYITFLLPLLTGLSKMNCFPNSTIYLLLDDAHMLSLTQTQILNSWVSTRTSRRVSLKISTQYNYKTYYTNRASSIDSPHDYSEVDMATIYTTSYKDKYKERIIDIIKKRFAYCGINIKPEDFFPVDVEQEKAICEIEEEYKKAFDCGNGRGYNRADDAIRYARPDYIKSLAGRSKSSITYSYSGLDQLIHISSGVIRYFLEAAHTMYAKQKVKVSDSGEVKFISPSIQNEIVRSSANDFFFTEIDKLNKGDNNEGLDKDDLEKLRNLIDALGGVFRCILLSDRSERRVFSIAVSDKISDEVDKILELGIQLGYFQKSSIGKKNAITGGRTKLFVLSRRLAPIWNLDPTGFAGYLFLKNKWLELAISNPESLLRRVIKEEKEDKDRMQMPLFDDDESPILIETMTRYEEE